MLESAFLSIIRRRRGSLLIRLEELNRSSRAKSTNRLAQDPPKEHLNYPNLPRHLFLSRINSNSNLQCKAFSNQCQGWWINKFLSSNHSSLWWISCPLNSNLNLINKSCSRSQELKPSSLEYQVARNSITPWRWVEEVSYKVSCNLNLNRCILVSPQVCKVWWSLSTNNRCLLREQHLREWCRCPNNQWECKRTSLNCSLLTILTLCYLDRVVLLGEDLLPTLSLKIPATILTPLAIVMKVVRLIIINILDSETDRKPQQKHRGGAGGAGGANMGALWPKKWIGMLLSSLTLWIEFTFFLQVISVTKDFILSSW